jgi:hypothetical protein
MSITQHELEALPELEGETEGELELEGESELEGEQFLSTIVRGIGGLLGETEGEREFEGEGEFEGELEGEFEGELEGEGELEFESEGELEGEQFLSTIARGIGGLLGETELEGEGELEFEGEGELELEGETEFELNPVRRVYPDAMMEHLGHAAAEAESEAAAEAFLGALLPIAARALPSVMRAAPRLIPQIGRIARVLRRNPATRPLVRAIPTIVQRTANTLARQAARGRPITARSALRVLDRQTSRALRNPYQRRRILHRARVIDRRYHRGGGLQRRGPWVGRRRGYPYRRRMPGYVGRRRPVYAGGAGPVYGGGGGGPVYAGGAPVYGGATVGAPVAVVPTGAGAVRAVPTYGGVPVGYRRRRRRGLGGLYRITRVG